MTTEQALNTLFCQRAWYKVLLAQEPLYHGLNRLYSFLFFNIKHPDRYIRDYKNKRYKTELMLRRSEWRDYYDIYSILKEDKSLKSMVARASNYSNHRLKTRDALNFLSNSNNYKKGKYFHLLKPVYDIDSKGIEELIRFTIRKEYCELPIFFNKSINSLKFIKNEKN